MKAPRQAHARYFVCGLVVCGCAVYQPGLLGDQADTSTIGDAGDGGVAGLPSGAAGSAGSGRGGSGGGGGSGTANQAGSAGSEGGRAPTGGGGVAATEAGAAGASDGGAKACVSETVAEFCTRLGKDCAAVDGLDNCGNAITQANCGTCKGFRICAGGGSQNVCGALTDPASGGIATASSVGSIGENGNQAFDLNVNSKWFGGDNIKTGWIAYQFPGTTTHVVTSYSITSANDVPTRDPKDWQLQGSSNGGTWTTVDQRSGEVFASRHQTITYTCTNTTPYHLYRLLIAATNGASSLQLAELVLYGN